MKIIFFFFFENLLCFWDKTVKNTKFKSSEIKLWFFKNCLLQYQVKNRPCPGETAVAWLWMIEILHRDRKKSKVQSKMEERPANDNYCGSRTVNLGSKITIYWINQYISLYYTAVSPGQGRFLPDIAISNFWKITI